MKYKLLPKPRTNDKHIFTWLSYQLICTEYHINTYGKSMHELRYMIYIYERDNKLLNNGFYFTKN